MTDVISGALQENILTLLCFDDEAASLIVNSVDIGLFESEPYKEIARQAVGYYNQFSETPKDHLGDLLEAQLNDKKNIRKAELYKKILVNLYEFKDGINSKYVLTQVNTFVRQQRLKVALIDATTQVKEGNIDNAENVLTSALKTQIVTFDPGIRFTDTGRSLGFFDNLDPAYSTGIAPLDNIGFGPAPGELLIILAPANRGKCIYAKEKVLLSDGSCVAIEEVVEKKLPELISYNETTGCLEPALIRNHYNNGEKECFKITTRLGRQVTVTKEHPFLTPTGWKAVTELKDDDFIAVPRSIPDLGKKEVSDELAAYLGYMIAEGCLVASPYTFTNCELDIRTHFKICVEALGSYVRPTTEKITVSISNSKHKKFKHNSNPAREILKNYGLHNHLSKDKFVPKEVFTWCKKSLQIFLNKLFTCDGSIYFDNGYPVIEYTCASEQLINDINHLMLRFGIIGKIIRNPIKNSFRWSLRNKRELRRFIETIGFSSYKKEICNQALEAMASYKRSTRNSYKDLIPYPIIDQIISAIGRDNFNTKTKELLQDYRRNKRKGVSFDLMQIVKTEHPSVNLESFLSPNIYWDNITNITNIGLEPTYDLTVEPHHNFIANDILVHNTWCLIHLGKFCALQRLKVLHLSLEMSEEKMAQRYVQNFYSYGKRQSTGRFFDFNQDEMGRFVNMSSVEVERPSLFQLGMRGKLEKKLEKMQHRLNFWIKRFPTGALTIQGLESYLDSMERFHHFHPDVLIVDYADLMSIQATNLRVETGNLYKELRRVAVERNMAVITASQSNRLGEDAKVISLKHLAEDYSKAATADNILAYCQTSQEMKLGLARLFIAKARDEEREQTILISQCYRIGQFCMQAIPMQNRYWDELEIMSNRFNRETIPDTSNTVENVPRRRLTRRPQNDNGTN